MTSKENLRVFIKAASHGRGFPGPVGGGEVIGAAVREARGDLHLAHDVQDVVVAHNLIVVHILLKLQRPAKAVLLKAPSNRGPQRLIIE